MENLPMEEIYIKYQEGTHLIKIAEQYSVTTGDIRKAIISYCKKNGIKKFSTRYRNINKLPSSQKLYELCILKKNFNQLSKTYNVSPSIIRDRVKQYCVENGIDYTAFNERISGSSGAKNLNLPIDEIYNQYKQGYRCFQIAQKYNASESTIRHRIHDYCDENNLEYVPQPKLRTINLPMKEIYESYMLGYTIEQIAQKYNVSENTIRHRIHDYCDENNLEYIPQPKLRTINLPMKEIYESYMLGYTIEQIAQKYNVSESTISYKIKNYCGENKLQEIKNKRIFLYQLKELLKEEIKQRENNEYEQQKIK